MSRGGYSIPQFYSKLESLSCTAICTEVRVVSREEPK